MDTVSDPFSRHALTPCRFYSVSLTNQRTQTSDTWFRYLIKNTRHDAVENEIRYIWLKFNIFTRWEEATKHTFLVVFDPKPPVKEGILSCIVVPERAPDRAGDLEDPYWIHVQILQHVTSQVPSREENLAPTLRTTT